jgi:hypothetical protein
MARAFAVFQQVSGNFSASDTEAAGISPGCSSSFNLVRAFLAALASYALAAVAKAFNRAFRRLL